MGGIVFDSFDFGLDLRRGPSTSPANRLRDLTNCYISTGKEIVKRPGLELVATLEAGTKGLKSGLGKLNTFYESGTITHANTLFQARKVEHSTPGSTSVSKVWYCDAFNGYLYVSVEYVNGDVKHHYMADQSAATGTWTSNSERVIGSGWTPSSPNGRRYKVTTAGWAGYTEPTPWPTTVGTTHAEPTGNYLTWGAGGSVIQNQSVYVASIDRVYACTRTGVSGLTEPTWSQTIGTEITHSSSDYTQWAASTAVSIGAVRRPTTANGYIYFCTTAGTTGGSQPTWPTTPGQTVTSGGAIFVCQEPVKWKCYSRPAYTVITTLITDQNCPHGRGVTKTASKIWSTKAAAPFDVVKFSKTDDCTNWTEAGDAGFLSVGLKQENAQDCRALGQFQDKLVCFFQDSAQLWSVDTNPANNKLAQRMFGVGTRYPQSPASFADDVFFLADQGVRSITVNQQTANLQDSDIGSPIDSVVPGSIGSSTPFGVYIPPFGQFWLILGARAWVYTFSRNAKLAAWAPYTFPFPVEDLAILDNIVYIRNGNNVYKFSDTKYTDNGSPIKCRVQFPYLDCKKPGVLKQFTGMDVVIEGSAAVSFLTDGNDQGVATSPTIITGDTRPGPSIPVEVCAPAIAPVFQHAADEPFKITALSLSYYDLGQL